MNQSLWVISIPEARKCFGLANKHLKHLPVMRSIPGRCRVPRERSRQRSIRFTSVKAAKDMALQVHGSLEALQARHPLDIQFHQLQKVALWEWYRQAPSGPLPQDPATIKHGAARPDDPFAGMGATRFPSIVDGRLEHGH